MKFIIDECVLAQTAKMLRQNRFSVVTIQELGKASVANGTVIKMANKEKAIIITTDLDFGNLKLYPSKSHCGVILLRPRLDTLAAIEAVHVLTTTGADDRLGSKEEREYL